MSFSLFCAYRPRRWFLAAGWVAIFGVHPAAGQTPKPEGSDAHPSYYQYPLRTWTQREPVRGSNPGRRREDPGWRRKDPQVDPAALTSKLQIIVIPRIEFRNTTLTDAVELLRQESRRLDPESRGVNVFFRLPEPSPRSYNSVESIPGLPPSLAVLALSEPATRVTLTLERLPLLEALKYVALQTGTKVQVEQYGVSIVPLSYAIPALVTADYRVPPILLGLPADVGGGFPQDQTSQGGEVTIARIDMASRLESKGVAFPPGACAVYLPGSQKLVVRNTQENLDKIVSVISSALKPSTPAPANP